MRYNDCVNDECKKKNKKKMCENMYEFIYSVVYCGLLLLKDVFIYRVYFGIIILIGGGGGVWGISVFIEVIGGNCVIFLLNF